MIYLVIFLIIICIGVLGFLGGHWLAHYLHRRKKFRSTFERAKARMAKSFEASSRQFGEPFVPPVKEMRGNLDAYFQSEAEAREFNEWIMDNGETVTRLIRGEDGSTEWEDVGGKSGDILDAEVVEEKE